MIPALSALDKDAILFSNTHKISGLQVIPNSPPASSKKDPFQVTDNIFLLLLFALRDVNYQKTIEHPFVTDK